MHVHHTSHLNRFGVKDDTTAICDDLMSLRAAVNRNTVTGIGIVRALLTVGVILVVLLTVGVILLVLRAGRR